MFKYIVGFAALMVAGCAAFFSVQGLATLYAGQFIAVCVMAGALEIGKLVAASYLHRYWKKTNFLLKTYLIIAIITLMGITSLGIYGFLTSAFQQSHVKIEILENKQQSLESTKNATSTEIENLNKRIDTLNQTRLSQEKRLPELSKKTASILYEDIKKSNEEIKNIQNRIITLSEEVKRINEDLISLKSDESKSTDIGTLKFVAQTFGISIEDVVKIFTLLIVFTFDPLAVSLVLAYSNLTPTAEKITIKKNNEAADGTAKYRDA
jgi:hypothetical protein